MTMASISMATVSRVLAETFAFLIQASRGVKLMTSRIGAEIGVLKDFKGMPRVLVPEHVDH